MAEFPVIIRYESDEDRKLLSERIEALSVPDARLEEYQGEEAIIVSGVHTPEQALDRAGVIVHGALDGTRVDSANIGLAVGLG